MSVAKLAFASATVVSSSALWQAFGEETMPVETAVTRFVIVLVVSWIALSFVAELVFPNAAGEQYLAMNEAPRHQSQSHHEDAELLDEG